MKLIYLWIYHERNIKEQGFSFDDKFSVSVHVEPKKEIQEKNALGDKQVLVKLEINKNREGLVPDSFYGEAISGMTAVVGQNAAGKTTLLRGLMKYDNMEPDLRLEKSPFVAVYYDEEKRKIYIESESLYVEFKKENKLDKISRECINDKCVMRKCYVSNVFNWGELGRNNADWLEREDVLVKETVTPAALLSESREQQRKSYGYRTDKNQYQVNIQRYAQKESQSEINAYIIEQQKLFFRFVRKVPDNLKKQLTILRKYELRVNVFREDISIMEYYTRGNDGILCCNEKFEQLDVYEQAQVKAKFYYEKCCFLLEKEKKSFWDEIYILLLAEVYLSVCGSNGTLYQEMKEIYDRMELVNIDVDLLKKIKDILSDSAFNDILWCKQILACIDKISEIVETGAQNNWSTGIKEFSWGESDFIPWFMKEFENPNSFFVRNVQIIPQAGSSGEFAFVNLFTYIDKCVSEFNIQKTAGKTDVLLLIDEIDCYFHPVWQQKIISYLIEWLSELYKNCRFQLVVSSHSPIILSDFFESQIIKLKQVNEKITVEPQRDKTFGANIPKLYFDSFFMDSGQIGELAKQKIQLVLEYLNDNDSTVPEEEILYIIEHIGDDFVRNKLFNRFHSKKMKKTEAPQELRRLWSRMTDEYRENFREYVNREKE